MTATDSTAAFARHEVSVIHQGERATWLIEVAEHQYPNVELTLRSPKEQERPPGKVSEAVVLEEMELASLEGVGLAGL